MNMPLAEFSNLSSTIWSLVAVVVIVFIRKIAPALKRYKEAIAVTNDIGCEKRHWLFGHALDLQPTADSIQKYLLVVVRKFPKCSPLWFGPFTVYLQCFHPDTVKTVLSTEGPKDDIAYCFVKPWIGEGLVTSSGKKWKRNRRLLTPIFHFDALKKNFLCVYDALEELMQKWSSKRGHIPVTVEVFHDVSLMTLDIILRSLLSKLSGCQQNESSKYLESVKFLTEATMERLFNPIYHSDSIFYLSPTGRKYKAACKVAQDYTEITINERKVAIAAGLRTGTDLDFLDTLLMSKDEHGNGLSHQEVCDEVNTFIFEGHDTVSSGISWALYNLAAHRKYQERCRKEVNAVIGGKTRLEWADLSKLPYLTMCIKESMRLYPPIVSIARKTDKPLYFPRGFGADQFCIDPTQPAGTGACRTFPKDFKLATPILMLHHNPNVWENPELYDPDRFNQENISKRSPHAYIPFSAGPRNCIGQNFAMMEMKVVLSSILTRFLLSVDDAFSKPELEPHIILRSKTGIHLKLEKLGNN